MAAQSQLVDWNSGLCDCFEDASSCCYAFWCYPCHACSVSKKFGENTCLPLWDVLGTFIGALFEIPVCVPPAVLSVRVAMRHKYGIKGSLCEDIAISCFCQYCSWCQMHRELKHRTDNAPTVITMQSQAVYNVQPAPMVMVNTMPPQPGFVTESGLIVTQK